MKNIIFFFVSVPAFAWAGGWMSNINLKVVDEDGAPAVGVLCKIGLVKSMAIPYRASEVRGLTDSNGCFSVRGETMRCPMCTVAKDDPNVYACSFLSEVSQEDYTVVLRKRGIPISLIKEHSQICEFPYPLEKVEYDCFLCDYLPPYGKGKQSDITIYLKGGVRDLSDPEERDKSYWYDTRLIVSQGKGGFVLGKTTPESEYFYTRVADSTWNWKPEMHYWVKGRDGGQKTRFNYVKNHMVFRVVRKVADVDHYYYGVIRRFSVRIGIPDKSRRIDIETMINPNPDDPNIEFDGHALKPQDPKAPVAKAAEK